MNKLTFGTVLVSLAITSRQNLPKHQQLEYSHEAEVDAEGNIYVSSDQGKLIWMGSTKRCWELREANDRQTFGCRVMAEPNPDNPTLLAIGNLSERRPQSNHCTRSTDW